MKFYIDSTRYFAREEENGALSLINRETNSVQFLNRSARRLLDACDVWTDFDEFIDRKQYRNVPRERVYGDFLLLLYELDSMGLAELKEVPEKMREGVSRGVAEDYAELSAFLQKNISGANTCGIASNPGYYGKEPMFSRLRGNATPYLMYCRDGKILCALEFSTNQLLMSSAAITLQSVIADGSLTEEELADAVKKILDAAADTFCAAFRKIRYGYMHPRQEAFCKILLSCGFEKTATLEKELRNGQSLILYDRFIGKD